MAKSNVLNFTQNIELSGVKILLIDTTALKPLFTAGVNDSVVKAINVQSSDTASARIIQLWVNDGTTDFLIGSVNVPASSGNNGTAATVDLLGGTLMPSLPYDANGKRVLPLPAGYILKVNSTSNVALGNVTVVCMAENY
jgi:hypothetical protein